MEHTAAILRQIYSTILIVLLTTLITHAASPHEHSLHSGTGADFACEDSMTSLQAMLCPKKCDPKLLLQFIMDAAKIFKHQCHKQFKYERWDCTNVNPLSSGITQPFLTLHTKEAAFVYALASAALVRTVAQKCVENEKTSCCGCDRTLIDEDGETWGCSPDMKFSTQFAEQFLNNKENDTTLQHKIFVKHNSEIGRSAVVEHMIKDCICLVKHESGECSQNRTCTMMLPTMDEVAKRLREQYNHSMLIPSSKQKHAGKKNHYSGKLVYFTPSPSYCTANEEYNITGIAGRECTLNNNHTSSSHHCDNLCCDHGYEIHEEHIPKPCHCKFVWCCHVECDTCHETKKKHVCKGKLEES